MRKRSDLGAKILFLGDFWLFMVPFWGVKRLF